MAGWRRVTKAEDPRAFLARRYTRAAPGKFRKSSKTVSFRQYQQKQHGGATIEAQIKERRKTMSNIAQHKSLITRGRNKELRELTGIRDAGVSTNDSALINEYLAAKDRASLYRSWSGEKQLRFRHLFAKYPEDLVRGWLGSSLESRRARMFRRAA